jgi:hypothetical protein
MSASSLLAAVLLVIAPAASQPEVGFGLGNQSEFGTDGSIRVPVVIGPLGSESVAALQFDLLFETSQLRFDSVEPGPSALDGSKSTHANPIKPGTARIIVAGLNRNALADGVVAWARFSPAPGAQPPFSVRLSGVVLSDPYGTAVNAHAAPDTLSLDPVASVALASDSGMDSSGASAGEYLIRYRALLLAALFIGGAAFFARRPPRKGRAR